MNTKVSTHFQQIIQDYLENRAINDDLFVISFRKPNKGIDDCITYILNTVQKSGCNGFSDDEVFSMAVHYYDEDNIEVGKTVNNCRITVNHSIELTAEEKKEARQKAIDKVQNEAYGKMTQPKKKATTMAKRPEMIHQPTLF
jgi:hypothetical protein